MLFVFLFFQLKHTPSLAADTPSTESNLNKLEQNVPKGTEPEEFFNAPTYLTVSGQLHLEAMAW